jgi:hypothetical protein
MRIVGICSVLMVILVLNEAKGQQAETSILVSGAADLVRTDVPGVIRRHQVGAEVNYFYLYNLSISGGYEFNHSRADQVTIGGRFYPIEPAFIRLRGLIGGQSDLALGLGYTYNITYRIRLEGMVDYYAVTQVAGLRAGIGILIN